ncbi:hypothetical protein AgCh_020855 [Apium graveolens]
MFDSAAKHKVISLKYRIYNSTEAHICDLLRTDPDAEVIALSPTTLMARNRFVCEICNKGFQRDQNLQLHRRGHNLPWKLKQRNSKEVIRKKVYVCPETSCVHHEASRALGDLTGIKKHFSRKHGEKKWKCERCSKHYAVQSDWKAHSKTCGTREYRCDCGTIFSRRDSFITHRAFCDALAEESAKSIPAAVAAAIGNPLHQSAAAAPTSTTSTSDNNNNNPHSSLQPQLFNNLTHHFNAFSMKKEQQNIPQWLAPLGMGPHSQTPMIFNQQQFTTTTTTDHHNLSPPYHQDLTQPITSLDNPNPNPSSSDVGPGPTCPPANYIMKTATTDITSPHMSATALLQKAALMGATISTKASSSSLPSMSMTIMRPHRTQPEEASRVLLSSFKNKDAYSCLTGEQESHAAAPPPPPTNSFNQDHIVFDLGSSRVNTIEDFSFSMAAGFINSKEDADHQFHGGGIRNNGGMTRDFLGLRPLSNSDIVDIANLQPNFMNPNSTGHSDD